MTKTACIGLLLTAGACAEPMVPATPVSVEPASGVTAVVERERVLAPSSPLDLVEDDGQLLTYVDLAALRRSLLYGLAKAVLLSEERELEELNNGCGFDAVDAVEQLAISMHDVDRETPLVAARINIDAAKANACVRKLFSHGLAHPMGEHEAWRAHDSSRAVVMLAVDDLFIAGPPTEVKRALERRGAVIGPPAHLRKSLPLRAGAPFALVLETGDEELSYLSASADMQGQRLALSVEARFRDGDEPATHLSERAEEELHELRDELGELAQELLGGGHPLVAQLAATKIERRAAAVRAALSLAPDQAMQPAFDQAIAAHALNQLTSEAKNTVGAIARGAVAAYEREMWDPAGRGSVQHTLCKPAIDVPSSVPRATSYTPDLRDGFDFETGDAHGGWRCLKLGLTQPHRYQYSYRSGGNYKGPTRGGPDPGKNGFEASAEGDLDGDGKTSLFTRTGTVDPQTGMVRMSPGLFISDELE